MINVNPQTLECLEMDLPESYRSIVKSVSSVVEEFKGENILWVVIYGGLF